MSATKRFFRIAASPMSLIGIIVLAPPVVAQTFEVTATGTVQQVIDPGHLFDTSVIIGTPIVINYLFDYSAPGTLLQKYYDGAIGGTASYQLSGVAYGATVSVGDYLETQNPGSVSGADIQYNYFHENSVSLFSSGESVAAKGIMLPTVAGASINLDDQLGQSFSSYALPPLDAYQLSKYSKSICDFDLSMPSDPLGGAKAAGVINTLSARLVSPAVPEPTSPFLLGVGAMGLVAPMLRARKRQAA